MLERLYTWSIFCSVISSSERRTGAELACSGWASTFSVFSLTLSRLFLMPSSSRWICCRESSACQLTGCWCSLVPTSTLCQIRQPDSKRLPAHGRSVPTVRRSRAEKGQGSAAHRRSRLGAGVPMCRVSPEAHTCCSVMRWAHSLTGSLSRGRRILWMVRVSQPSSCRRMSFSCEM